MIATRPGRLRRALTSAATVSFLVVPLAACTYHDTDMIYQPAQGVNSRDGDVNVLNALVVSGEDGEGRFIAGLANDGDETDEITGLTSVDDPTVEVELGEGDPEIPPGGFVQLADEEAAQIMVTGEAIVAGGYVRLLVEFAQAEAVELNVPIVAPGPNFADLGSPSPEIAETPPGPTEEPLTPEETPADDTEEAGEG